MRSQLEEAASTFDLARRLGRVCVSNGSMLAALAGQPEVEPLLHGLEARVERLASDLLRNPAEDGGFGHVLDDRGLREAVEEVEAHNPIEHLAFLRGILPLLQSLYDDFEGRVEARAGTPLPIAGRGVNSLFRATPSVETCGINDLLRGSGFYLFEFGASGSVPVILDFGCRDRLDELTWAGEKRLPRVATVHPSLGPDGIEVTEQTDRWFFGVRPREFEAESVLEQLRAVAGEVEVALLPELSLPQADSLESALAESPGDYPPLVVAGSAHVREPAEMGGRDEIRANESRIYLDGRRISGHRKIHPFEMRRTPDGRRLEEPLLEGITRERKPITILAGEFTRLAVLICADLHDRKLPIQLEDGRVNLLLVPALTPEPGGFNGGVCGLASRCQGVSVIANVDSTFFEGAERPPFAVMVGVPRAPADEQSREFSGPGVFPATAVIDPNQPLPEDLDWRVAAAKAA